jgi:hypothetical protein
VEPKIILARLHKNTDKTESCWLWKGYKNVGGYGVMNVDGWPHLVNRLSAWIFHGLDLESKLKALHKDECPNQSCWNPEHLYVGTQGENIEDWHGVKGYPKQMRCDSGHPLEGKNLAINANGYRYCRTCNREYQRQWRSKRRAQC